MRRAGLHQGDTRRVERWTNGRGSGGHVAARAAILAARGEGVDYFATNQWSGVTAGEVQEAPRRQGNGANDRRVVAGLVVDDEDIDQRDIPHISDRTGEG